MTISVACDSCGKKYNLRPEAAGQTFVCQSCGEQITVPSAGGSSKTFSGAGTGTGGTTVVTGQPVSPTEPAPLPSTKPTRSPRTGGFGLLEIGMCLNIVLLLGILINAMFIEGRGVRKYDLSTPQKSFNSLLNMLNDLDMEAIEQYTALDNIRRMSGGTAGAANVQIKSSSRDDNGKALMFIVFTSNGISENRVGVFEQSGFEDAWILDRMLEGGDSLGSIVNEKLQAAAFKHLNSGNQVTAE